MLSIEYRVVGEGRGGTRIVETAIAVAQTGTLVNGPQRSTLNERVLDELVANYARWLAEGGAPVPGYFGHATDEADWKARQKGTEQPALYVLRLWRDGKRLMGRLEFMPWAWSKVYADGAMQFRGLSIRMIEHGKDRNGKPIGAVFGGVDIVPEPFLPVTIAASRAESWPYRTLDHTCAMFARADAAELATVTFAVEHETRADDGQQPFLDAIERVRAEAIVDHGERLTYGEAIERAADRFPSEFALYLAATGRA